MKTHNSVSENDTKRIGEAIGARLKPGSVVALSGELGAGKTTLVKGIAKGLGVRDENDVSSPTFTLIHEYKGRCPVFHIDWYRLAAVSGPDEDMAGECIDRIDAVTLVEWAERAPELLPKDALRIRLEHRGEHERRITVSGGKSA